MNENDQVLFNELSQGSTATNQALKIEAKDGKLYIGKKPLFVKDGEIMSKDEKAKITLTPETINAIKNPLSNIIPSIPTESKNQLIDFYTNLKGGAEKSGFVNDLKRSLKEGEGLARVPRQYVLMAAKAAGHSGIK